MKRFIRLISCLIFLGCSQTGAQELYVGGSGKSALIMNSSFSCCSWLDNFSSGEFYEQHNNWIWLAVGIILLQSLIIFLIFVRRMCVRLKSDLSLSRSSFDNIMESSPFISIIVTDVEGKITLFNSGSEKMLGYTQDDVKGLNILTCFCPEVVRERFENELREKLGFEVDKRELMEYVSTEKDKDTDLVYVCKDGSSRYVDITVSPIKNNRGNTNGYLVVAIDLSEVHKTQRQLEESQRFLRSVIDAIPVRVFWKDCNSVYLGCNKVFAADAGLDSPDMIIGRRDSEMHWGGLAESYVEDDRAVISTRMPKINFEESLITLTGSMITIRTSKIPLFDLNDEVIGLLGMYENITDYKRMQEIVENRIISLTRYIDDPGAVDFEKIFNIDEIQRIQDEFSMSTNVAAVIVSPDGRFITKSSRLCRLCKLVMNLKNERCKHCFDLTGGLVSNGSDKLVFRTCDGSGLSMAVSPILVGSVHIASWILGQVRVENKADDELVVSAKIAGVDPEVYIKSYNEVPCMTKEKFESIANSARTLCTQLSIVASQNIQQAGYIADEKVLTEEVRRYHAAIQQIPDGVIILGADLKIQYVNSAFTTITGYSQDEAIGMSLLSLCSGLDSDEMLKGLLSTVESGKVWNGRLQNKHKDGTVYVEESLISPVVGSDGKTVCYVATMRDITIELSREETLRQRQKMAAVGQLASGVAHDFNNILQAILGFSELLMGRVEQDSVNYQSLEQINIAAKRGAALTKGLLVLGRKDQGDDLGLKPVDLNHLLQECSMLLNLISSENIEIVYDLSPDLWPIVLNIEKFHQVLMNLVMNARDAMPDGGKILIQTSNIAEKDVISDHVEFVTEDYVCLTVEDEGCGINAESIDKIFNPFYTTKDVGKGTGLGLSMVYIHLKNIGGHIAVSNKTGGGAKFFIYLPKNNCIMHEYNNK